MESTANELALNIIDVLEKSVFARLAEMSTDPVKMDEALRVRTVPAEVVRVTTIDRVASALNPEATNAKLRLPSVDTSNFCLSVRVIMVCNVVLWKAPENGIAYRDVSVVLVEDAYAGYGRVATKSDCARAIVNETVAVSGLDWNDNCSEAAPNPGLDEFVAMIARPPWNMAGLRSGFAPDMV